MNIDNIIEIIKEKEQISLSYLVKQFSIGYIKAKKIYLELIEQGYINQDGLVIKKDTKAAHIGVNVIFLDVDGVLNCCTTKDRCCGYVGIDDKKVSYLKEIVDSSNSIIVLVSTWKKFWIRDLKHKNKQDEMAKYLDQKLAKQGLIIYDKTNDNNSIRRGKGILQYIEKQKREGISIEKYVILDDEIFDYFEEGLTGHWVETNFWENGLEKKDVKKALDIFKN